MKQDMEDRMNKQEILAKIKEIGLIAVIRGPSPDLTDKMVEALMAGGVSGIEITYSTPNGTDVVKNLNANLGERILLGMGTLTRMEQVKEAKEAGARFIVSPICEPELGRAMVASGLTVMIGALTPTEVYQAYCLGSDVVKLFPGSLTGPAYVKALKGPFPEIPLMPTGGVSKENVSEWFAAGVVAVGAGSELCPPAWAKEGRFSDITARAQEFVEAVRKARSK
jgi:2-dehydro-3-deoxyphosphogluconate aldolase/(4S)-4-hydroxy-2-oxoglutarate aldolase